MANIYNAAQIVGKTLYAYRDVEITRNPSNGATSVFTVKAGAPIGIVYSFLSPKTGRSNLWWVFQDANKREYYAEHKSGLYDFRAINAQGAKDTETIIKEAEQATQPAREFWSNKITIIAGLILAAYLLKEPIKNALNK